MGGSTLLLTHKLRPQAFLSMALMEPVLLPSVWQFGLRQIGKFFPSKVPPIQRALNRVDRWPSQQNVYDHFRPKAVFKGFSDQGLWDLVEHSTTDHVDEGVTLRFTKEAIFYRDAGHGDTFSLWNLETSVYGFTKVLTSALWPRLSLIDARSREFALKWRSLDGSLRISGCFGGRAFPRSGVQCRAGRRAVGPRASV